MSSVHAQSAGHSSSNAGLGQLPSSRRAFLGGATVFGAGLAVAGSALWSPRVLGQQAAGASEAKPAAGGQPDAKADSKFADIVPINTWAGGGVWAIISNFGMPVTLCNGGIIAGKDAVVLIEGFISPAGSAWAAKMAKELTGRDPTHIIITHYHFDHTDGLASYLALRDVPSIISTKTTRELLAKRGIAGGGNLFAPAPPSKIPGLATSVARCVLPDAVIQDSSKPLPIDIGGKTLLLRERSGHTASDLNIEIEGAGKDGQKVVFGGDMIFHKVFPVYLDALPKALRTNVAEVSAENGGKNIIIPGHGPMATGADLKGFLGIIDFIAAEGAKAKAAGLSAKDAAAKFTVPAELKDYSTTNALFVQLAFEAIYRELDGK